MLGLLTMMVYAELEVLSPRRIFTAPSNRCFEVVEFNRLLYFL